MIPRRVFWLFDAAVLFLAFLVACGLVPRIMRALTLISPSMQQLVYAISMSTATGEPVLLFREVVWVLPVTAPVTLLVLWQLGNYRPLLYQSRSRIIVGSFLAPVVGLSFAALILASFRGSFASRLLIFSFALIGGIGFCLYRLALRRYFEHRRAAGYYARNVLLLGLPESVARMTRHFRENVPESDYRMIGYITPGTANGTSPAALDGANASLPCLGIADCLGQLLINRPIHEVIAVQSAQSAECLAQVVQDCDYFGILLRIVPEALLFGERRALRTLYPFEPLHLPAVVLAPPHWDSDALFLKRLFDIAISTLLLVLLSPVIGVLALILKLREPSAPVFYRWRVVGQNGVPFTGYKFRTMVPNADALKSELQKYNEMTGPVFKMRNDPRVTPVGRILRKYSLDELPQLWSVLKGDMSLVGPRPAGPHELSRYEFWHKRKLSIRPGMTCLWQIRGRNAINNFDAWVKMDLEYIDNWSLWLDFKILAGTAWAVVSGTGV